jgi:hypothetical protein
MRLQRLADLVTLLGIATAIAAVAAVAVLSTSGRQAAAAALDTDNARLQPALRGAKLAMERPWLLSAVLTAFDAAPSEPAETESLQRLGASLRGDRNQPAPKLQWFELADERPIDVMVPARLHLYRPGAPILDALARLADDYRGNRFTIRRGGIERLRSANRTAAAAPTLWLQLQRSAAAPRPRWSTMPRRGADQQTLAGIEDVALEGPDFADVLLVPLPAAPIEVRCNERDWLAALAAIAELAEAEAAPADPWQRREPAQLAARIDALRHDADLDRARARMQAAQVAPSFVDAPGNSRQGPTAAPAVQAALWAPLLLALALLIALALAATAASRYRDAGLAYGFRQPRPFARLNSVALVLLAVAVVLHGVVLHLGAWLVFAHAALCAAGAIVCLVAAHLLKRNLARIP